MDFVETLCLGKAFDRTQTDDRTIVTHTPPPLAGGGNNSIEDYIVGAGYSLNGRGFVRDFVPVYRSVATACDLNERRIKKAIRKTTGVSVSDLMLPPSPTMPVVGLEGYE
ncbi:hypothetical protein KIPB_013363, partial [Kipferlia bialata]|eukprot:g13363.t1